MNTRARHLTRLLVTAIAAVALLAPAALAGELQPASNALDRYLRNDDRSLPAPDAVDRYVGNALGGPGPVVSPDDRALRVSPVETPGPVVSPDDRALRVSPVETPGPVVSPDDRALRVSPVETPGPVVSPDDRAAPRGSGAAPLTPTPLLVAIPGGFDWTDAGIGAAAALGLVLLVGGAGMLALRHRKTGVAAF